MIAIAIQAIGYIYTIIFQVLKDLMVASLKVVGLILNIVLLVEIATFCFSNACAQCVQGNYYLF